MKFILQQTNYVYTAIPIPGDVLNEEVAWLCIYTINNVAGYYLLLLSFFSCFQYNHQMTYNVIQCHLVKVVESIYIPWLVQGLLSSLCAFSMTKRWPVEKTRFKLLHVLKNTLPWLVQGLLSSLCAFIMTKRWPITRFKLLASYMCWRALYLDWSKACFLLCVLSAWPRDDL